MVNTWGLLIALGFLVSLGLLCVTVQRWELFDPRHVLNIGLGVLVSSMVGARVTYVLDHWGEFASFGEALALWDGGLGMMGGVLGAAAWLWWYARWQKISLAGILGAVAYVLPLGIAVGRCGCHLIGDHPGEATGGEWGFVKPDGVAYHEPAIYEAVLMLALFVVFALVNRFGKNVPPRFYTAAFLVGYGVVRLLLDFTRLADPLYAGLTLTQYAAILMILFGLALAFGEGQSFRLPPYNGRQSK